MNMQEIFKIRVVPAATVDDPDAAVPLAEAMLAGGLNVLEITLRTKSSFEAIRRVSQACPEMVLGAGTIISPDDLDQAVDAGARFGVAPGLSPAVIERAAVRKLPMVPGVATSTEITAAHALGCRLLKFFPAGPLGGVPMLQALAGPFAHLGVRFIPTGGVGADNAAQYLALPVVAAVGGSWMVKRELIAEHRWADLTRLAREAVTACAVAP